MSENFPEGRTEMFPKLWIRFFCVFCLLVVSAAVIAGKVGTKKKIDPESPPPPPPTRVLMIGDSLSVGKFGEFVADYLVTRFGATNVALFASCGSSPENWLRGEPDYFTKCGYRERTSTKSQYLDWANGKPPPHIRTPKVEDLIERYRPNVVVVQQGTNWMDGLAASPSAKEPEYREYARRFVAAIFSGRRSVTRMVWIMPPDSSHFSPRVESAAAHIIEEAASGKRVDLIDSRRFTHYVAGKTGGDGIHYNSESSQAWAHKVTAELQSQLPEARYPSRSSTD